MDFEIGLVETIGGEKSVNGQIWYENFCPDGVSLLVYPRPTHG